MAPRVNKLTPEVRCLPHPSRSLGTDIVAVSEKYNSSYNTGSDLDPRKIQGAYGIMNARLGLGAPDNKWAVEFWSANLTDKYYYQVAFDAPYRYGQIDSFLGAPRTFGVTARVKF